MAPPAPGASPRVFLEETRTGGITSPHLPDPPSPLSGFPEKPRLYSYITWGLWDNLVSPAKLKGRFCSKFTCN